MEISHILTTSLWCIIIAIIVATAAFVPHASAQGIQACADGQGGNISYSDTITNLQSWGSKTLPCVANAITGLHSVSSFAYQLTLGDGTTWAPMEASGIVIDPTASNSALATVNISALLPTTGEVQLVTAAFASPVALDPQRRYLLAFCASGTSNTTYQFGMGQDSNAISYCTLECTSPSGNWQAVETSSPLVLITDITGSCVTELPSPSPSPLPSAPPRSPTPSPSAAPARSSASRRSPDKALGARAVRFVLSKLCALFE